MSNSSNYALHLFTAPVLTQAAHQSAQPSNTPADGYNVFGAPIPTGTWRAISLDPLSHYRAARILFEGETRPQIIVEGQTIVRPFTGGYIQPLEPWCIVSTVTGTTVPWNPQVMQVRLWPTATPDALYFPAVMQVDQLLTGIDPGAVATPLLTVHAPDADAISLEVTGITIPATCALDVSLYGVRTDPWLPKLPLRSKKLGTLTLTGPLVIGDEPATYSIELQGEQAFNEYGVIFENLVNAAGMSSLDVRLSWRSTHRPRVR